MNIYLVTDTHFGHQMLVDKNYRPAGFEQKIINGFEQLKPEDMLIHLGDICIGKDEYWHNEVFRKMRCRKILVLGNHDHKSMTWYNTHGWDFVCQTFSGKFFGKYVLFSHEPIAWDGKYDVNIHGHHHSSLNHLKEPEYLSIANNRQKLIALEHTNYQLVSLRHFLDRL